MSAQVIRHTDMLRVYSPDRFPSNHPFLISEKSQFQLKDLHSLLRCQASLRTKIQGLNAHNIPWTNCIYMWLQWLKKRNQKDSGVEKWWSYFCPFSKLSYPAFPIPVKSSTQAALAVERAGDNNDPTTQASSGYLPPNTPHLGPFVIITKNIFFHI